MTEKIPLVMESLTSNHGKRTVIESTLAAGASVPLHFHTQFDKTFEVLEGEISILNETTATTLRAGESFTIGKEVVHSYVVGNTEAIVKITLEPGNLSFENAMKLINGIHHDGEYARLSTLENNNMVFMAIIAKLTDAHYMGEAGATLDTFLQTEEGKQVMYIQNEMIEKYCV